MTKYMWDTFWEKLDKEDRVLTYIARRDAEGYKATEILRMIGKTVKEKSWFYRQKDKIRDRWIKYNAE